MIGALSEPETTINGIVFCSTLSLTNNSAEPLHCCLTMHFCLTHFTTVRCRRAGGGGRAIRA